MPLMPEITPITPPEHLTSLMHAHAVQPLVAHLLATRGVTPSTNLTPDLTLAPLPNLTSAAELIAHHVRDRNRILIHGDYDADGMTGASILVRGLRALGGAPTYFIPNRLTEPYGLNPDRIDHISSHADLLITVDCGIANADTIREYRSRGLDVIVTDHHPTSNTLPDALIVHPTAIEQRHDFDLTGAGVAYHLLWATQHALEQDEPPPNDALITAAIGTIADVASLTTSNRAIIQHALIALKTHPETLPPGLVRLAEKLNGALTATSIAFGIAPLLNAAGRLGHANDSVELLLTDSDRRASTLIERLDTYNHQRRQHQKRVSSEAHTRVDPRASAIVLDDPSWHAGVIGIAAAELCTHYGLPTYLSSSGRGSARTPKGVHATEALAAASDALDAYGGHAAAAGFTVTPGQHQRFADLIRAHHQQHPAPDTPTTIEAILPEHGIDNTLLNELAILEPHAIDNPAPALAIIAPLRSTRVVGSDRTHLQLTLDRSAPPTKGIAFGQAHLNPYLPNGITALALAELALNTWNGNTNLEFSTRHVQPHTPLTTRHDAPQRVTREPDLRAPNARVINNLPSDPLEAIERLRAAHASNDALHYALTPNDQQRLHLSLDSLLTRDTVKRHALTLHREGAPPEHTLTRACQAVLREVDLLDEQQRLRVAPRNLYRSATLTRHELARYALTQLLAHYQHADSRAFALATERLFGPAQPPA